MTSPFFVRPVLDKAISATSLADQLFDAIQRQIADGTLRSGARLPSIRKLAFECRISAITVINAYNRLIANNYLRVSPKRGYFVCENIPVVLPVEQAESSPTPVDDRWMLLRPYEASSIRIGAGCGWLPDSHLFCDGVAQSLRVLARRPRATLCRYGDSLGYAPLRKQFQTRLYQHGVHCDVNQVVLTNGATQALELIARRVVRPGDTVLVDDPGYCNLLSQLKHLNANVIGVPRTVTGPDVASLRQLAAQWKPKLFFTNSVLHNPTGTSTFPAVAHDVLAIACEHDFFIVEDNVFADLAEGNQVTLASLDQLRRVIYVGSVSKTVMPSLRVGFLAAPRDFVDEFLTLKMVNSMTTSELGEKITLHALNDGRHRTHLSKLRERLRTEQEIVCRRLTEVGMVLFHAPGAGMFVWARFPNDVNPVQVTRAAAQHGIVLAPGCCFRPGMMSSPWLRFNVALSHGEPLYRLLEHYADGLV